MKYKKMTPEQKMKNQEYKKRMVKQVKFELHKKRDADLIRLMEAQKNKQGFIKSLLRDYLKAQ